MEDSYYRLKPASVQGGREEGKKHNTTTQDRMKKKDYLSRSRKRKPQGYFFTSSPSSTRYEGGRAAPLEPLSVRCISETRARSGR